MNWKEKVLQILAKAKDKVVIVDLDKKTITYNKVNNRRESKFLPAMKN